MIYLTFWIDTKRITLLSHLRCDVTDSLCMIVEDKKTIQNREQMT